MGNAPPTTERRVPRWARWLGIAGAVVIVGYLALMAFLAAGFAYYGI